MADLDDPNVQKLSDHLIRLVQVVFALVLAQSLFLFRNVVVHPFSAGNFPAALALFVIFATTVRSWIDWHTTMVLSPYETRARTEGWRLTFDLGIVIVYAFLLFTVEPLVGRPDADIRQHLVGYPSFFFGYLASGLLRRKHYGPSATRLRPIYIFLAAYAAIWVAYAFMYSRLRNEDPMMLARVNVATLGIVLLTMVGYRLYRHDFSATQKARKAAGLKIGIDLDGVLANQIVDVLPRIKRRLGVALTYEQITDWRLPIGSSDIAKEIELAHEDESYVSKMPIWPDARKLLRTLYKRHRVIVLTARSEKSRKMTRTWLNDHFLLYDGLETSQEARKSAHGTDVLIDDYIGNVAEFLETRNNGVAVLVDQPWNRDRAQVSSFVTDGRLWIVRDLEELLKKWPTIEAAASVRLKTQ